LERDYRSGQNEPLLCNWRQLRWDDVIGHIHAFVADALADSGHHPLETNLFYCLLLAAERVAL